MATQVFTVQVGTPLVLRPGPYVWSICAQPGSGGSVLIDYSIDNGQSYVPSPLGAAAFAYSMGLQQILGSLGIAASQGPVFQSGPQNVIVRVTATTAAAVAILSDLSVPSGGAFTSVDHSLAIDAVAYAMPNTTSEQALFSMRFPAGYLRANCRVDVEANVSSTNNVNVKTLKAYLGIAANATVECAQTALLNVAITSSANSLLRLHAAGRNDGQAIVGNGEVGLAGAALNVQTTVTLASQNYAFPAQSPVEQALVITGTKATGTDTLQLDQIKVVIAQG